MVVAFVLRRIRDTRTIHFGESPWGEAARYLSWHGVTLTKVYLVDTTTRTDKYLWVPGSHDYSSRHCQSVGGGLCEFGVEFGTLVLSYWTLLLRYLALLLSHIF